VLTFQLIAFIIVLAFEAYWLYRQSSHLRTWAATVPTSKRILKGIIYLAVGLLALFAPLCVSAISGGVKNDVFTWPAFLPIILGATLFIYLQTLALSLFVSFQIGDVTEK